MNMIPKLNESQISEEDFIASIGRALVTNVGITVMKNNFSLPGKIEPGYKPGRRKISKSCLETTLLSCMKKATSEVKSLIKRKVIQPKIIVAINISHKPSVNFESTP